MSQAHLIHPPWQSQGLRRVRAGQPHGFSPHFSLLHLHFLQKHGTGPGFAFPPPKNPTLWLPCRRAVAGAHAGGPGWHIPVASCRSLLGAHLPHLGTCFVHHATKSSCGTHPELLLRHLCSSSTGKPAPPQQRVQPHFGEELEKQAKSLGLVPGDRPSVPRLKHATSFPGSLPVPSRSQDPTEVHTWSSWSRMRNHQQHQPQQSSLGPSLEGAQSPHGSSSC